METQSSRIEQGVGKVTGISQIVRLKELLNKWQSVTLISKRNNNNSNIDNENNSSLASIRLTSASTYDMDVEEGCGTLQPPPDVPKGFLAVYVGKENRRFIIPRFIIPTSYFSHNLFKILLEKVEEEYGFDHAGALTIPCEIETFKYLLKCIETHPESCTC